ncbi:MAG TPA: hypothetical protein VLS89_11050, partial [Candidatus Nanopelagicales bacterium]|nr:hypothetical protein [Candidatus Nanopelagicales bacterium]
MPALRALLGEEGARRFRQDRAARLGVALAAAAMAFAALGPLLSQHHPEISDFALSRDALGAPPGPSAAHWLGTDSLGRDIASLLLVGAQNSIVVGLVAVGIGLSIGVALGCVAAVSHAQGRGWIEELIMRFSD